MREISKVYGIRVAIGGAKCSIIDEIKSVTNESVIKKNEYAVLLFRYCAILFYPSYDCAISLLFGLSESMF